MDNDMKAAELVARFEMAVIKSSRLQDAYRNLGLAAAKEAQTAAFNASEDAQAKRDRYRLALLEALTGKERSNEEEPGNVWKGAATPLADNH